MTNGNESASGYGFTTADGSNHLNSSGLTKREYFAAMAMQGMVGGWNNNDQDRQEAAKRSVKMADALINALNQSK